MEVGKQLITWHSMDEDPLVEKYSVDVLVKVTGCGALPAVLFMNFCKDVVRGKEVHRYKHLNPHLRSVDVASLGIHAGHLR